MISTPASKDFLALSQAPPALFWKIAQRTPLTVTPACNHLTSQQSQADPFQIS
ncbi:hypothetical protein JCM19296_2395 [Nonlabens ulvanivorans]|uniref:Uncharacterized protein n=1 Tax=Nonlabens ulvanivorans TaxID=906888 RepID=A0A081DCZ9_NONUL|nr:hypothetical protein JCM19296_2395 [Nonlabens ulvanivorans]